MSVLWNPRDARNGEETLKKMQRLGLVGPSPRYERYGSDEGSVSMSSDDLLLQERIIFIGKPIDNIVAHQTIMLLLFLQSEDATRDISIYINSPGGMISAGMAIY